MVALSVSLWKRISVEAHPTGNETLGGGKTFLFFLLLGNLTSQRTVIIPLARVANELSRMKAAKHNERGLSARAEPSWGSGWEGALCGRPVTLPGRGGQCGRRIG